MDHAPCFQCGLEATERKYSYGWTAYLAFHSNISSTTHASSLWLAVFMAILRYVYLQTKKCCNVRHTCMLCVFIVVSSCLFMVPNYILTEVIKVGTGVVLLEVIKVGSAPASSWCPTTS